MSRLKLLLGLVVALCLLGLSSLSVAAAPALDLPTASSEGMGVLLYACPPGANADLTLRRNGAALEILNMGTVVATRPALTTIAVIISGPYEHDAWLTVDYAGGPIAQPVSYTGRGHGFNRIALAGGAFGDIVYTPLDPDAGAISADGAAISYVNVQLLQVMSASNRLSVVLPAFLNGAISLSDGLMVDGLTTTEISYGGAGGFAPIRFASQANLTVYGNAGANIYTLGNPHPAAGLQSITINGSDNGNAYSVFTTLSGGVTTLNTGAAHDVVTVHATNAEGPLFINGQAGDDDVDIGNVGSVQGILGEVTIANAAGASDVHVNDSADPTSRAATISDSAITGLAPAAIRYAATVREIVVDGGSGGNTFTIPSTIGGASLTVNSGSGADTVHILTTSAGGPLTVNGQAGADTVTVGDAGSVQSILANVAITNAGGSTALTVDDAMDASGRTATLTATQITGLAPAAIGWQPTIGALVINGSQDVNTFLVSSTIAGASTVLNCGPGGDAIAVESTAAGSSLAIHGQGGQDSVVIGQAGSVQAILGAVSIENPLGQISVVLDDSADTAARVVTIADSSVTGLAPQTVSYSPTDVNVLIVHGGSGGNAVTIASIPTASNTTVNVGVGSDTIAIQTTADLSSLTVNGQAGSDAATITEDGTVQGILGLVSISAVGGQMTLLVDDSADTVARTASISDKEINGLAPARILMGDLSSMTIRAGQEGDTLNLVPSADAPFFIEGGNPTPPALPGDTLNLDLTGVDQPVLTMQTYDATGYSGAWTFANRQPVRFTTLETLKPTAALSIAKVADVESVVTGEIVTYTITLNNGGPNAAENVLIGDLVPPEAHFQWLVAPAGWTCHTPEVGHSGLVECYNPLVAAGATAEFKVAVRAFAWPAGGAMVNEALVTSSTADPDPSDNQATATVRVLPRLAVAIGAQREVLPATWIARFSITVTNESNALLPEVTITDPLPDPSLFVQAFDGGELIDGVVTWTLTDMAAGEQRVVRVEIWTNSTFRGIIDNWVTAAAYGFSISANKAVRIVAP
jgi:uncharacterized repeat protein (TIGR01451 family)